VSLAEITPRRVPEAADALARAMLDDAFGQYLVPDPAERLVVQRRLYADTIERAMAEGRVDAWGDPIVGVAVWLRRRALVEADPTGAPSGPGRRPPVWVPPEIAARAQVFGAVLRELRELARPDRHAYLDSIGVLPDHRRRGIASRLLDAGHAWADAAGLPCALDTLTDENVAFYERRGYRIVATAPVPGSGLRITAMRRHPAP
jgi:ribosomal protein S18 acetylase RimI-like enzyme